MSTPISARLSLPAKALTAISIAFYVTVYDGFILTVSGAIAADEFDLDSYSALYLLYWQTLDMLIE